MTHPNGGLRMVVGACCLLVFASAISCSPQTPPDRTKAKGEQVGRHVPSFNIGDPRLSRFKTVFVLVTRVSGGAFAYLPSQNMSYELEDYSEPTLDRLAIRLLELENIAVVNPVGSPVIGALSDSEFEELRRAVVRHQQEESGQDSVP